MPKLAQLPTPEEQAQGASLTGDQAVSQPGGQSLQAQGQPNQPNALTPEKASDSPDFRSETINGWNANQALVDQNPKKYAAIKSAMEAAKAAGKGPGDFLDHTPQDKITRYLDTNGNPAGAVFFANAAVDHDGVDWTKGGKTAEAKNDKTSQPETRLKWTHEGVVKSLDPNQIPYVSLPGELKNFSGAKPGDLVRMRNGDHIAYGVYADVGPHIKAGEISVKAHELLNTSKVSGLDDKVNNQRIEYTVMAGTGVKYGLDSKQEAKSSGDIQMLGAAAYHDFNARIR